MCEQEKENMYIIIWW